MPEQRLMRDLVQRVNHLTAAYPPAWITRVHLTVGMYSHFAVPQLCQAFLVTHAGSGLERAELDISLVTDLTDPQAYAVVLDGIVMGERPDEQ